jgi:hypothetical protein
MFNKKTKIFVVFILIFTHLYSDDAATASFSSSFRRISGSDYKNYFGYSSGYSRGFTYRRWISDKNGLQITVNPYFAEDAATGKHLPSISITPAAFINFARYNYFRFLGYASGTFVYVHYHGLSDRSFWVGAGGGIEYYIWRFGSMMTIGVSTANGELSYSPVLGVYYRF